MKSFLIISNQAHPFFEKLQKIGGTFCNAEKDDPFEQRWSHYDEYEYVFDFTTTQKDKKILLLQKLSLETNAPIISDLSIHWGDYIHDLIPGVSASVACNFFSPQNTYEVFSKDEISLKGIAELFKLLDISMVQVKSAGIGFQFPRVISMIINEAFFSLEDELATREDIDRAMKFGVNYPLGPFEWCKKIGTNNIVTLLTELYTSTGDPRYKVSTLLQKENIQG